MIMQLEGEHLTPVQTVDEVLSLGLLLFLFLSLSLFSFAVSLPLGANHIYYYDWNAMSVGEILIKVPRPGAAN